MILTHDVGLSGGTGARWLGELTHGLALARVAGAQIVIVRVESPWAVTDVPRSVAAVSANDSAPCASWCDLLALVRACPLPTLAVVEGAATAEAVALIAGCDVVLATEDASFAAPLYETGTTDDWAAQALASLQRRLTDAALTAWSREGGVQSARWCAATGLVDGIFADPGVTAGTARCARALAGAAPAILRAARLRLGPEPLSALRSALPEGAGERTSSSPPPELRLVRVPSPQELQPSAPKARS